VTPGAEVMPITTRQFATPIAATIDRKRDASLALWPTGHFYFSLWEFFATGCTCGWSGRTCADGALRPFYAASAVGRAARPQGGRSDVSIFESILEKGIGSSRISDGIRGPATLSIR